MPPQRASLTRQRQCMSYVAIICDNKRIQALLPQLLLVSTASVPARIVAAARKQLTENVWIVAGASAWNSHRCLMDLAQVLGRILAPLASQYQPVFIMDTARCHLVPCVTEAPPACRQVTSTEAARPRARPDRMRCAPCPRQRGFPQCWLVGSDRAELHHVDLPALGCRGIRAFQRRHPEALPRSLPGELQRRGVRARAVRHRLGSYCVHHHAPGLGRGVRSLRLGTRPAESESVLAGCARVACTPKLPCRGARRERAPAYSATRQQR